jgi:hypothetical protein
MKKIVFLVLLLASSFLKVQAQISKGTILAGGNIGYNQVNNEIKSTGPSIPSGSSKQELNSRSVSFNPSAGLFLADNLAFGLTLGINDSKTTQPYYDQNRTIEQGTRATSFSAAPFLRYYYLPSETFGFYGQLTAGYSYQRIRYETDQANIPNQTSKSNGGFASITPAFVFFPTPKLGLELTAGSISYYRFRNNSENSPSSQTVNTSTNSNFGANFGLSNLTLGASYYIGRQ